MKLQTVFALNCLGTKLHMKLCKLYLVQTVWELYVNCACPELSKELYSL
uniref:Uncharacterized protein n=1 Tax=Moniliophthora roreri TaxID=221103 RepID=A0A0W0EYI6_MONRR